jgi:hypothetical protein
MATIANTWVAKTGVYKGQLHAHSDGSDGADTPTEVMTAYEAAGFDFAVISDHDTATADPEVAGILFIPATEESSDYGHINGINYATNLIGPVSQYAIDTMYAAGALAQINHANWSGGAWTTAELLSIINARLFEVWNNEVAPNENAEDKYDGYLSSSNKRSWCTAVDDCHDVSTSCGKGWVMVNADECTLSAIMAQLEAGNFYASTGAVISNITLVDGTITITTPDSSTIVWKGKNGTTLKTTTTATSDTYTFDDEESYIRVVITRDSDSKQAWSQPLFITPEALEIDDEYTVLLLHFDGEDDGVVFVDQAAKEIGIRGNVCTKTGVKKFGTASAYFDDVDDSLNFGDHEDFRFGSGAFTIDFWLYPTLLETYDYVFGKHADGVYDEYYCYLNSSGVLVFRATTNETTWNVELTSAVAISINTHTHVEIVRDGNCWMMFIDRKLVAANVVAGTIPTTASSLVIGYGYVSGAGYSYSGYIDEFRISKGIARHTSVFTPPASELSYDAGYDKALLHMNGDDNGTTFTDEAGKEVTRNGDTCTKTATKKFGSASGYFDGTGDYLSLADSADFEFADGDFTIDFWMNPSSVAANKGIFNKHTSGDYDEYYAYFSATGIIKVNATSNGSTWNLALTSGYAITTGSFYHIAWICEGDRHILFIGGCPVAVIVSTAAILTDTNAFWIGRATSGYYQGYIDDFRVSKGVARWEVSTFDLETEAYGPEPPAATGNLILAIFI